MAQAEQRATTIFRVVVGAVAAIAVGQILAAKGLTFAGLRGSVLTALLVMAAARDAREYRIPNRLVLAVLLSWVVCFALEWIFLPATGTGLSPEDWAAAGRALLTSGLGAVASALPVAIITWIAVARGGTGFGAGDVKLLFAVGLWFPWKLDLVALVVACVVGAGLGLVNKVRTGEGKLPFGVGIAVGWWILCIAA